MKKLRILFGLLALIALLTAGPSQAQQTPAPQSTPALSTPALTPLPISPLANSLGQTLQTLVGTPSSQPAPVNTNDNGEDSLGQISDNFASDIFDMLQRVIDKAKADSAALSNNVL